MARYNDIRTLAENHAAEISSSVQAWTGYLDTAATLYRYDFHETLLIHAQRPEAAACAEMEIWNKRMGRWINRGAKGIALIDDSGPRKALRYVFDISDTHMVRGGKTPYIWQMEEMLRPEMSDYLADAYGIESDPDASLSSVLKDLAKAQAEDSLADAMDGLSYEARGTYLEGLGEDAVREGFRRLLENSTYYLLSKRCGLDPWDELTPDDFSGINDFNSLSILSFLGNAVHEITEPILRDIGREVIFRYRVIAAERKVDDLLRKRGFPVEKLNGQAYNKFNTLIRESTDESQSLNDSHDNEGGTPDGSDIHEEGGLSVSESDDQRGAGRVREVRNAPEDLSEGEQEGLVSEHDADRETGRAPAGDRRDGQQADGEDLGEDGAKGRRQREAESGERPGMDPEDEQHPEPGGGDRTEGIGVQLISDEYESPEAEDNGSPAFSMPEITLFPTLPTAEQQRRQIEQRMDAVYAGEVNIPAGVIDEFLRKGGNKRGSQLRIIYNFMTEQKPEEYTEFVRREYGKGGRGLVIDGRDYSLWFDEAGMKIASGHSTDDPEADKAYLAWEEVSDRIRQLLAQGEYAPQSVLDAARDNAVREHATALIYMEHDLADGIAEIVFDDTSIFEGGFPNAVTKVSEKLEDRVWLTDLVERLEGLAAAYEESPDLMRFPYYNPERMLAQFRHFTKEAVPYTARDGFSWEEHRLFITEEEADAFLASGGPYSDGRLATTSFFLRHEDTQERAEFLKNQYGTGGRSHALSGADDSNADYNTKGILLTRGNGDDSAQYRMSYTQAANRIDALMQNDRFLTAQDLVRMPAYEREQMAGTVISFYSRLPAEIERPFSGNIFDLDTRKEISTILKDPARSGELVRRMDAVIARLPESTPDYQRKVRILSNLHGYIEGSYTLFPQQRVEIVTPPSAQLSLADLFDLNVSEETKSLAAEAVEKEPDASEGDSIDLTAGTDLNPAGPDQGESVAFEDDSVDLAAGIDLNSAGPDQEESVAFAEDSVDFTSGTDQADVDPQSSSVSWEVSEMTQQTLQPLSADAAAEYNALKQQYPDALIGFEQNGYYEFYGEDARRVADDLEMNLFKKTIPGGEVDVTGFEAPRWQSETQFLWGKGNSILLAGEKGNGSHSVTEFLRGEDFLPLNAEIRIDDRDYRIDSVDFENGTVTLQDMTMAREARYPIFRTESIYYVRSYYEEQHDDPVAETQMQENSQDAVPEASETSESTRDPAHQTSQSPENAKDPMQEQSQRNTPDPSQNPASVPFPAERQEEMIEQTVSAALQKSGMACGDYSPEQMDVIYEAAEQGFDPVPLCNPSFSPEQMQLIMDINARMKAHARAQYQGVLDQLTGGALSIDAINTIRAANLLPLEEAPSAGSAAEPELHNFRITDDDLGAGSLKAKFRANMDAIYMLKTLEAENRLATADEQEVLSRYVGWGGIPQAFDDDKSDWAEEAAELRAALTPEEYREARASTLNAFYTSPTVIRAMYQALEQMGLSSGNMLEPSCGIGNFMGLVPDSMSDMRMYGVELDSVSGRIAQQLYQRNTIAVQGFETTSFPDSFFDAVIGNVPFGQYKVADPRYDRQNFLIHDYFIAKSLDLVRPGGVVAVVTSSGTMDKQNESVRRYLAQRADLLGAVRLPNNAFMRNANTGVVADILFFQKRDRMSLEDPDWVHLDQTAEGHTVNAYFVAHPEMVLGRFTVESTQYGRQEVTVRPLEGADLGQQLREAVTHIHGEITPAVLTDSELEDEEPSIVSIPADPSVKNFSFTNIDGHVFYRENSRMNRMDLPAATAERVLGMIELRDIVQELLQAQLEDKSDVEIASLQRKLSRRYDEYTAQYGIISSKANRRAFSQDASYCLLSSLEILDEEGKFERKADIFTKRTIRRAEPVTSVDTASEALALSIGEKARVDLGYMASLTGMAEDDIVEELAGVIFRNPVTGQFENADEYLSGNVREKLQTARNFAEVHPEYRINVEALERVQPKDLDASEIEVRLGATWVDPKYITQFMGETFKTPWYLLGKDIDVRYAAVNGQWNVSGKNRDSYGNPLVTATYGTTRVNAYRLLEDALNLRDTRIYDVIQDSEGKERRVLNKKETMLAQQKQEMIKEAFKEWVFRDIDRREGLCKKYNELFNSIRPREYDGSHIRFVGMTPEISLMQHQKNAVAHILYGGNTLLAHCVGAGKTFLMVAAGMESKRLGLARKCLYVVPNHLTEQWGSDFLRLYPGANILVSTKKDFEPSNRKKFCSRIATGDYDAVIIGHSQFERIPLSRERQVATIQSQIDDIEDAIQSMKYERGESYTVKQMEKTRRTLEVRLAKLNNQKRKDDVVTFEQLGVDRLFVDESHFYKNAFFYTKMRNVAGIAQTDAQKCSDMFMKCQYLDEITGGKGITFATGTPISNSMVELYTVMRYLQYSTLQKLGMGHFDSWAAAFGETVTAIELAPEGTGYRAKTRFARFYNLPELITLFKESADIQTPDMLDLPVPEAEYINEVLKPSDEQKELVASFADRAEMVRAGKVQPTEDNMLKITNDGRKCALDQRLINPLLPDNPESKVNRCVENMFKVWKETAKDRLTQLCFCDLSTPKGDGSFNVYDDIREKLMARGIPKEEVAFIHEANTETRKEELFAKVRAGQVRILLGSTPKLGAGTNVQDRLIALHHLDCPWKPSDLEQQEGRILRQGNRNPKVQIYRYVTESSFDSYMWQILEQKQKFISQIMTSKSPVRSCEDVDDTALSYAEIKALATGNPAIKQKMDLDVQVSRLKLLKANHTNEHYRLESDIARTYPVQITATRERIGGLKADLAAYRLYQEHQDRVREKQKASQLSLIAATPAGEADGSDKGLANTAEKGIQKGEDTEISEKDSAAIADSKRASSGRDAIANNVTSKNKEKEHEKESFTMTIGGKEFTDRKEAGTALIAACAGLKAVHTSGQIGEYAGFTMSAAFDGFTQNYLLTLKRQCSYTVEVGRDPVGNVQRVQNALNGIDRQLQESEQKLDNLQQQLAAAKEEVRKPFAHEAELVEKSAKLAELNAMLNMDEHSLSDTIGIDEETDQSVRESSARADPAPAGEAPSGLQTNGENSTDHVADLTADRNTFARRAEDIQATSELQDASFETGQAGKISDSNTSQANRNEKQMKSENMSVVERLHQKKTEITAAAMSRHTPRLKAEPAL